MDEKQIILKNQKKNLVKIETDFEKLTELEKAFVTNLANDSALSPGAAVMKLGIAESPEEAVSMGISLLSNPLISRALDEMKSLMGITPNRLKELAFKIATSPNSSDRDKLSALQIMGRWYGMENSSSAGASIDINITNEKLSKRITEVTGKDRKLALELLTSGSDETRGEV